MFKRTLAGFGITALLCTGALAGTLAGVTLSDDGKTAIFAGTGHFAEPPQHDKGTRVIFSNIGTRYPKGEYFCCFGDTISGSQAITGSQSWVAAQFASLDDVNVTEVDVAAEWADGTNEIDISLYTDRNGIPDRLLKTFTVTGLQGISGCCGLAVGKDAKGIANQRRPVLLDRRHHTGFRHVCGVGGQFDRPDLWPSDRRKFRHRLGLCGLSDPATVLRRVRSMNV